MALLTKAAVVAVFGFVVLVPAVIVVVVAVVVEAANVDVAGVEATAQTKIAAVRGRTGLASGRSEADLAVSRCSVVWVLI